MRKNLATVASLSDGCSFLVTAPTMVTRAATYQGQNALHLQKLVWGVRKWAKVDTGDKRERNGIKRISSDLVGKTQRPVWSLTRPGAQM